MEETRYGLRVTLPVDYNEARGQIVEALKKEGFGVLTTIDVKQTLKQELDKDFRQYVILGACNPALASRALENELEIGLLLPCNVIVYETRNITGRCHRNSPCVRRQHVPRGKTTDVRIQTAPGTLWREVCPRHACCSIAVLVGEVAMAPDGPMSEGHQWPTFTRAATKRQNDWKP